MIEILILIVAVCITFLLTDYRRWLQIQNLKFNDWAAGYDAGYVDGMLYMRSISNGSEKTIQ